MSAPQTSTPTAREREHGRPYTAWGAAVRLWSSRRDEVVLSGPAGTGKSRACLEKLHFCALKYARMRGLIIRKTRESATETALVTYEDHVLPLGSPIANGPQRNQRQVYHYPNGSNIVIGGIDKPGKIMSTEYDMIYVQEAIELEREDWLSLTTRLRNGRMPYQQLIADTNPDAPTHWLWLRAQAGMLELLHSRHEDNPRLYRRDGTLTPEGQVYIARLDNLGTLDPETGERQGTEYQRLRNGLWVQATGQVYQGVWSDGPADGSVLELADYVPDAGPVLWAVDDGYVGSIDRQTGTYTAESHPRVILLIQQRADGRLCVFAESYQAESQNDQHIADTLALGYPAPDYAVVDKSAAELKGRLQLAGIYTRNGPGDVEDSIKALRRMLAADANGYRRVIVHPRCRHLRAEMVSYKRDANGKVVKQFDHGPDALRYLCWTKRLEQ